MGDAMKGAVVLLYVQGVMTESWGVGASSEGGYPAKEDERSQSKPVFRGKVWPRKGR